MSLNDWPATPERVLRRAEVEAEVADEEAGCSAVDGSGDLFIVCGGVDGRGTSSGIGEELISMGDGDLNSGAGGDGSLVTSCAGTGGEGVLVLSRWGIVLVGCATIV